MVPYRQLPSLAAWRFAVYTVAEQSNPWIQPPRDQAIFIQPVAMP